MNLSPRARTALQIAGYVALALITFVLALHLTFPYGRVKDKIVEAMSAKYDVTIGGVERSFVPGRFALTAVTLRSRPSVANEPVTTMYFKRVEVDIAFAPLLSKKVEIGLDVATAQGSMAGVVRLSSQATFVDFTLKKVPLATIPGVGDAVGLPLGGNADGRLTLDLPTGDWSKAKGKLDLTCTIGCTVGDGVTKIFPKARRESDQAFVKDGTVVPEIKITRFALGIDIAKGEAKSRKFDLVSPDGEAQLDFNIKLAKRIGDSTINGCISYKCSDELKSRAPKFAGTCDFGSPAVDERGFHDIKLSGKLTSMRRIGTTCDASGDDAMSGGVDRARARPNIDATPPTPVRPSEPPTPQPMPPPVDLSKPIDADKLEAIKGIDPSIGSGSGTGARGGDRLGRAGAGRGAAAVAAGVGRAAGAEPRRAERRRQRGAADHQLIGDRRGRRGGRARVVGIHPNRLRSISPRSLTSTPSSSSSLRWTAAPTGSWIWMPARDGPRLPSTRCHGRSDAPRMAAPATRAPPGMPASSATWP